MSHFQIRRPGCGAMNRVPAEKEGVAGRCGACHGKLPPLYSRPRQLTDLNFDAFIAGYPGPVLAEFWAPW